MPSFTSKIDSGDYSHPVRTLVPSIESIVHVTSWLSRQGGGIPPVVHALAREATRAGVECVVAGLDDGWVRQDCSENKAGLIIGETIGPKAIGFSPKLRNSLRHQVRPGAVVHSHGLWMHPGKLARECAVETGCPLVVSPHGMLEPWALNQSRWKKRLAGWLFEDKNLREAVCLHALCTAEAENFRRYGLKNPIAIIPNGVDLEGLSPRSAINALDERFPDMKGRKLILFLSRLHPKKGLLNLLSAWRQLAHDFKDWCLLIAGQGQPVYERELRTLVREHDLEKSVLFLGRMDGEDKRQVLAAADLFVLPSFSEGFSMAILEAAGAGLPVLLTPECNFPELAQAGAALEVSPATSTVEAGLRHLLRLSDSQRKEMGRNGAELVQRAYTWPAIARQMFMVYGWLRGREPMPRVVRSD